MNDDEERILTVELELVVPHNIDEASKNGGELGKTLFSKVIVALRNLVHEHGASGEDASNVIINAQIVSFAYTIATASCAMEGSSMLPEDIEKKVTLITNDVMRFTGELLGRYSEKGQYLIRERPRLEGDVNGP